MIEQLDSIDDATHLRITQEMRVVVRRRFMIVRYPGSALASEMERANSKVKFLEARMTLLITWVSLHGLIGTGDERALELSDSIRNIVFAPTENQNGESKDGPDTNL